MSLTTGDLAPDVIVIGGGPGGSTAATMLARKGVRVLLLERERFPRDHVGESLLPASVPVLEELGVLPAVQQAGFLPKWGATMVWGKDKEPWSWYFRETSQKYPHSYQVWRPQFDQLLLENSRAAGVDVREGHRVLEVLFESGTLTGVTFETLDGARGHAAARFVVDASGQNAFLARKLRLRRWDSFFRNLAVYGYFEGAQHLPHPDETNIFIEAYSNGWLWSIPLHTGQTSVGAVVDSSTGRKGIQRTGARDFLLAQVAQGPKTAKMLRNANLASGPHIVKDWSYVCQRLAGDGYVLVGDAACFVDPLFSSGVHLALTSGVLAAAHVTSALKDASLGQASGQVYQEMYWKEYNQFREMARLFYSSNLSQNSYFWEARRLLEGSSNFSPRHAFIRAVAGQPPRGYERAVLDRGQAPSDFVASVGAVEEDRARRRAQIAPFQSNRGSADDRFQGSVPHLADGVRVERKPVVGEGEFEWGYVVTNPGNPEGTPCSGLVAKMVSLIDGRASVRELLARLREGLEENQANRIESSALPALQILYVDGALEELTGL
jgi:flavin-dependent dehydrogenase